MLAKLSSSPSLTTLLESIQKGRTILLEELWDTPKALLLALAKKPILVITSSERDTKLFDDLLFFHKKVLTFPAWETLPGEEIAPSSDIVGRRLETLHEITRSTEDLVLLAPLQSVMQKVIKKELLSKQTLELKLNQDVLFDKIGEQLEAHGYTRCAVAADKGEFAVRGSLIDIYPVSTFDPVRIDFFGDTIDSIRTYDPVSQKTIGKVESVTIPPAEELAIIKQQDTTTSLLSYLPDDTIIVFDNLVALEDRAVSLESLPSAKSPLVIPFKDLCEQTKSYPRFFFSESPAEKLSPDVHVKKTGRDFYSGKAPLQEVTFELLNQKLTVERYQHAFVPISGAADLKQFSDVHLIASTHSEEEAMKGKLPLPDDATFHKGYLSSGVALVDIDLLIYPYTELSQKHKVTRQKWRNNYTTPPSEFHELKSGDLVVHFHNGIGKFLGIEKKTNHLGQEEEFMMIQYAEGGTLFAPLTQSHLISRYIGTSEEMPSLHKLGTKTWHNQKVRAQKAIIGYARDLIKYQAMRDVHGGFSCPKDTAEMLEFESDFPFTETQDQEKAIRDVKEDMMSQAPMDRLICGDVGYGKTEVAMRAAFKAVVDGNKQVAILAPTTVLAMQHYETFLERMANYPIRIGALSRFVKPKEQKKIIEEVKEGAIDILIGTHRLISKDISFKKLGLIIIDEEQRFGVRAKEHLKKMRIGVDCLTLSATPIPRTLYFSLVGARPMSVINTPPQDRLPIKTIIADRQPELIKNALLRELAHDGQAYFIHNRVESIYGVAKELGELLPAAKIGIVHGQMSSDEIDTAFHAFKSGVTDILCATTIVESGIDIPNANTILIDKAHHYGLADLYQLRGRVGRWNKPAYSYFLVPKNTELQEISRKRLNALVEASGFGGGMKLAMRDLEIRGAGDLLGTQQSGNVSTIGFHLYCKLLKRAIDTMKKNIQPDFTDVKMEFNYPASLPASYVAETSLRIELYHRLGDALTQKEVDEIFEEMKDRFGKPPIEVQWLYHLTRIRVMAMEQHIILMQFGKKTLTLEQHKGGKAAKTQLFLAEYDTPQELEAGMKRLFEQMKLLKSA